MTIAAQKLTATEFLALPEVQAGAWLELVNGEVIVSPRPNIFHSFTCSMIVQIVGSFVRQNRLGILYIELDTVFDQEEVRSPDLLYYPGSRIPTTGKQANQAIPELCIEILSPSNARTDRVDKFELYETKGVKYYWIVDPEERMIESYSLESGRYVSSGRGADQQVVKLPPFPTLEIPLGHIWHPSPS